MIDIIFSSANSVLGSFLPDVICLALWSIAAGAVSMGVYSWVSPREKLLRVTGQAKEIARQLRAYDGDYSGAQELLKQNLKLSLERVWLTLGPTVAAGFPVILTFFLLENHYAHRFPEPGESLFVSIEPASEARGIRFDPPGAAKWNQEQTAWNLVWPQSGQKIHLIDRAGQKILTLPTTEPRASVEQSSAWDALLTDPAARIPQESPILAVAFDYPIREMIPVGPAWMRSWLFISITLVTVTAMTLKIAFKIP